MKMKKHHRQVYELKLRGNTLQYRYLDKDGKEGDWLPEDSWEFSEKGSLLPTALFWTLTSYVMRYVKAVVKEKSVTAMMNAIERGLCDAAKAVGCTWEKNRSGGDVTWFVKGHRFYAFQIEDLRHHAMPAVAKNKMLSALRDLVRTHSHRFVKMEEHSGAVGRGSLVVLKNGKMSYLWKFVPGEARGYHIDPKSKLKSDPNRTRNTQRRKTERKERRMVKKMRDSA